MFYSDVNLLKENTHSYKKDEKALLVASKEVGLGVNSEQNKRMFMFREYNAGGCGNMKIQNIVLENVGEPSYLEKTQTNT
jgi:hypothetical protein